MRSGGRAAIPMLFLALAGVPFASAQSSRFFQPSSASRLEAGSTVVVSWAVDPDSSFEEMELVLSLDGGQTFPLRVTGELSPESSRVLWRVPVLAARQARLALRAGTDEDPGEETIRVVSDVFEIAPLPGLDLEEIFRVRCEWRTREARGSSRGLADQGLAGDAEPRVDSGSSPDAAGEPPAPVAATRPELLRAHGFAVALLPIRPAIARLRTAPIAIPLRQ